MRSKERVRQQDWDAFLEWLDSLPPLESGKAAAQEEGAEEGVEDGEGQGAEEGVEKGGTDSDDDLAIGALAGR